MNVTEIQLRTPGATPFKHASFFVQGATRKDKYILKAVTGLDIDEIVPKLYGRAQGTSLNYYSMAPKERTVVMLIKLNPQYELNQTVADLRATMYKSISFNRQGNIELRFKDSSTTIASLVGYISKVEASIMSPETDVQITIVCKDPFLRSDPVTITPTSDTDDHTTSDEDSHGGSNLDLPVPHWNDDLSTAPHGYKLELVFTDAVTNFTIRGINFPNYAPFSITYSFLTDDHVYFSSEDFDRYLYVVRGSTTTHLTDKIVPSSVWPTMVPGRTEIGFSTDKLLVVNVSYRSTYWGI